MNSKKILSMLLLSLGAFTMVLSGCKNNDNSKSDNPTSEKPSETTSEKPSSDTSSEATSSETTSSSEINVPEAKTWEVAFNVDVPKEQLTVWTDFAIDKSIAEELGSATNKVNMTGKDQTGRTLPLDTEEGMYYFAVDADGYLVYASYGLNAGFGSPSDGYYHNLDSADPYNMPFWALHDDFETWGTWYNEGKKDVELNGKKYYTFNLFNFIIPEGGFVIKGELKEQSLRELFKELVGQSPLNETGYGCAGAFDAQYNQQWGGKTVAPKELDKYYFYINDDHELALRERTADELKDAGGEQIKETPVHGELTKEDEVEKFVTIADVLALQEGKEVKDAKGVITYVNDTVAYVQDENGNTVRVTADALKDAVVGDTVAFSGTLATVKGQPQVNATAVRTIKGYGEVKAIAEKTVTADNVADFVGLKNNLKKIKAVKAEVKETNKVKIGDVEFTVDTDLTVGDFVDFTGYYAVVDGKNTIHNVEDVAKYVKITVNTGDVTESKAGAVGTVLEFSPSKADSSYVFVKWQVKNANNEWEDFSTEIDLKVKVGEADAEYQAIFDFAPWAKLPEGYAEYANHDVNSTSGDSEFTVWKGSQKFHLNSAWDNWSNESKQNYRWRVYVVVDAEGKICYAVVNPGNGFGGPSAQSYVVNSAYTVTKNEETGKWETNNPAFVLLDGYDSYDVDPVAAEKFEVVIPEGGFAITAHTNGANDIVKMITKGAQATADENVFNKRAPEFDDVRLYYDTANKKVKAYKYDEPQPAVFAGDDKVVLDKDGYTIGVDATGKVMYASFGLGGGYGGPADGFYHDGTYSRVNGQICGIFNVWEDFKPWTEDPAACNNYDVVIPEGGMIISDTTSKMANLIKELTGKDVNEFAGKGNLLFEENVVKGSLNNKVVKIVDGKITVEDKSVTPVDTKEYQPITYTDSKYRMNFFDQFKEKVAEKEAKETLTSELVTEIFYDNENAQMWADSGFSSIVYTDNTIFQTKTSAWGGNIMVVNKDGKIEYIGSFAGGKEKGISKDNYYLRAKNVSESPAVDANGNICIPEGGFAIQVWTGVNDTASHKLAYSGYDVIRSFVLASMGSNYMKVDTMPTDHIVGNTETAATKAYGENKTLAVEQGKANIMFSNIFTGYLDYLTVTRETVEDVYFKGKLVVSSTDTAQSIVQRALVKTEYARTVLNNDEEFSKLYDQNIGGINWGLDNSTAVHINNYLNGTSDHATLISSLKAEAMGLSYLGDSYKVIWAALSLTIYE